VTERPTVTLVIPVLNEEHHLAACLEAVDAQTYPAIIEVLVVDGGSTDATREVASSHPCVRVLDNPRRIQAAALNIGLSQATGTVVVRVDGHCALEPDYVERAVRALDETGAAMVGGAMRPVGTTTIQRGVALAMTSPVGAGPARFHVGGGAGWVDTVYLGAYRTDVVRAAGGYDEAVGVNEDAELAYRMQSLGGVWFDPSIRSTYVPRPDLRSVARQFYRYGRSRAATVRKHPRSIAPRQLAPPALLIGLASPWRRPVAWAYGAVLLAGFADAARRDARAAPVAVVMLPTMHVCWALGFFRGLLRGRG
jgi:glycosyltransferase involved in cell wall biosynthesis